MTEFVAAAVVLVAAVAVAIYLIMRSRGGETTAGARDTVAPAALPGEAHVTLPVDDVDPNAPAVQRLAADAAHRVLASQPDAQVVVVSSRTGGVLARIERTPETRAAVEFSTTLLEPQARKHHAPGYTPDTHEHPEAAVGFEEREDRPAQTLAERFDLPPAVRDRIAKPDDLVDIVLAILQAGGVEPTVDNDVLRYGNDAIIVLRIPPGSPVRSEDLNSAYIRFQQSGASRGVAVTTGKQNYGELRRRHALAPALQHAGADGIQRMADAVAMGADPLVFLIEVPVDQR